MDCLLAVTASFFDKGDKFDSIVLEECDFTNIDGDEEDFVEYVDKNEIIKNSPYLTIENTQVDIVKKDFIAFDVYVIHLGSVDKGHGGVASEIDSIGVGDTFMGLESEFSDYANEVREEESLIKELKYRFPLEVEETITRKRTVNSVCFVLVLHYWASQDYYGEWDSGIDILGRLTKKGILESLKKGGLNE